MTKIENTGIRFKTDVFAAVAVVDAKVPYSRCRRRRRFLSSLITKRSTHISAHAHWQPLVKYLTPLSPQPYFCSSYWPSKISLQQTTVTKSIISYLSVLTWPVNLQCVSLLKSKISKKIRLIRILRWEKKRCIQKPTIFNSFSLKQTTVNIDGIIIIQT